jgi:hypothetical protein
MGDIQALVGFPDQLKNYWYESAQTINLLPTAIFDQKSSVMVKIQ